MAQPSILILDYGTGNLNSIRRALRRIGARPFISSTAEDVRRAEKIILPGVGHFGRAMAALAELDLIEALKEAVISKGTPVLGICLGMELMAVRSDEGNVR